MKKILGQWVIILGIILSFVACGSSGESTDSDSEASSALALEDVDPEIVSFTQTFLTALVTGSVSSSESAPPPSVRAIETATGFDVTLATPDCGEESDSGESIFYSGCIINYTMTDYLAANCLITDTDEDYVVMNGGMTGTQSGTYDTSSGSWTSLVAGLSSDVLYLTLVQENYDTVSGNLISSASTDYSLIFDISVFGYSGADSTASVIAAMSGNVVINEINSGNSVSLTTDELMATFSGEACDYLP
ncbi:MAG: hypothetical protein A3G32_02365 [Deltaproteobacteria bacterium RIFCSPLOWO2_12_FULL_40_28]|nr:MAG: hypothetical protein A3C45_03045 [Deltaproteobacteria bacterium RIFCSPHIGHO2_02_FULL_40_28]OGQ20671.1 MAG: hypothetical protein A3E27_10155 [Deltaproteobacteria bacterium RIFCSPHIGHO2_12_FULL_40_32]OGQ38906.1 MAG: hypothetical protein A3I69_08375 [Deltaproteobacteria bacterium RIFCSPLOWO2_02_FULL_40_36]OGQ55266.1 MAG: hypothetical protein A3G32_02365 [Deltaproteobacteria bacterium RIFCSPLOWO2_12_FULL_40_28]